ncbi:MAG: hypothetical protein MJ246_00135 [Clostridia bacterium]|nr:hypothetical protein [Clostridia bacterium]
MEKDKKDMMKKEGKSKKKGLLRNVVIFFLAFGLITSLIPIGKMLAATSDPGNLSISSYNSSVFVEPEYKTILQEDDHSFVIKWNVANTNDLANKYDLTFYTPGEFFFESDSLLKNLTSEQMAMAKSSTYDYKTIKHVINVERVVAGKTDLVYKHNMYIFNTNTNAWDININDCFQVTSDGNTGLYVYDINASNGRGFYSNKTSLDKVFNDTYRQAGDRYIYKLGSQVFAVRWISGVGTDYCEIFVTNLAGMSQSTIYDFELAINNAAHTVEKKSFLGRISLDITPERYYVDKNSYNGTDRTFKISNIDYTSGDFDFRDANCRVASKLEFEAIRAFNATTQKFDYVGIQKNTTGPDTGYYTISGYDTIKLDIVIQGNNPGKGWDVDLPKLQNLFIDYKDHQSNADDNDLQDNDLDPSNGNPKQKDRCVLLQKDSTGK